MISRPLRPCFLILLLPLVYSLLGAEPAVSQRIEASFLLAQGRFPTAAEVSEWSADVGSATVNDLVEKHRKLLQQDPAAQRAVVAKAFEDAFGRVPDADELARSEPVLTYVEQVKAHIAELRQRPDEYRAVLDRAYQRVIRRGVYDEEIAYWNNFDVLAYSTVVGCVDNWGRRNQPGLMVTAGTPTISHNSVYLSTVTVSPKVAEEARAAAGLRTANTDYFSYASGRTVIAPGADKVVANGGVHFVAALAEGVVAR
jgi:hypothetical protein